MFLVVSRVVQVDEWRGTKELGGVRESRRTWRWDPR